MNGVASRIANGSVGGAKAAYGDAAQKHAATAAGATHAYSYDANGSVLTRTEDGITYTHTYDLEGRQSSVSVGGRVTSFIYTGEGRLAAKLVDGVLTTAYASGGRYERELTTGATTSSYALGGSTVAMRAREDAEDGAPCVCSLVVWAYSCNVGGGSSSSGGSPW